MSDQKLKQRDRFNNLWDRLRDLTGNKNPEAAVKVPKDRITQIFEEVASERVQKAEDLFKTKLIAVLETKRALDASIKKGREELAKKEEKEYEALNAELESIYRLLENTKNENQDLIDLASGNSSKEEE